MLIRQVFCINGRNDMKFTKRLNLVLPKFFCIDLGNRPPKREERKLRQWRVEPEIGPKSFFALWDKSVMAPKANRDDSLGGVEHGEKVRLTIPQIKNIITAVITNREKYLQRFIPELYEILGPDLTAAHFVLYREGRVKFRGSDEWRDKKGALPESHDPMYIVTALDCSEMKLYYEGLLNFDSLKRVKWASFRGNTVFDEWCMDHIVANLPNLEYLDVSDCPMLDERGLEAIYKLFNLKTLIVTNNHNSVAFELTCMMLEDCNPKLKCEILEIREKSEKLKSEEVSQVENKPQIS